MANVNKMENKIKIEDFMKLNLKVEEVNGENVVVGLDNNKKVLLSIDGKPLVPEKKVDSGFRVS